MSTIHKLPSRDFPVGPDSENAHTMPARLYLDEAVYEKEKEAIFADTWHYIGHECQVQNPGDYLTLKIADESVFIMRGDDHVLRGFFNVCRHRAHQLLSGSGNTKSIICPYHAWSYHKDGRLRHARFGREMPNFDASNFCLPEISVDSVHGFLFVNIDANAKPINELAPGLADDMATNIPRLSELKPSGTFALDSPDSAHWNANWKVVVDNYVECYHCHHAHPALADIMVMDSYAHDVHEQWARQISRQSRTENKAYPFSEDDDVQIAAYWYLWPTTSIWMVPGKANLFVLAMMPDGHDKTIFSGHSYSVDDADDSERAVYLNKILGPEDQGLCESVQRGLKSRSYNQGRFMVDPKHSGTAEQGVHQFHRLIMQCLGED